MKISSGYIPLIGISLGILANFPLAALADLTGEARAPGVFELAPLPVEGVDESGYGRTLSTTGTRARAQNRELPIVVNGLSRQLFEDQQAIDPSEATAYISNVQTMIGTVGEANQFLIRGFPAFTYVDGFRVGNSNVPASENLSLPTEMATVERIEVLKGPSTFLYGRGLPGGVINLVTKTPEPTSGARATLQFGSFDWRRATFDATGPLAADDSLNFRLIAEGEEGNSYRDLVEERNFSVYPSLQWRPVESLSFLLRGEFREATVTPDRGVLYLPQPQPDGSLRPQRAPFSTRSTFYGTDANRWDIEQRALNLEGTWKISDAWEIRVLTGVRRFSQDGTEIFGPTFNTGGAIELPLSANDPERMIFAPDHLIRFRYETVASREDLLGQVDHLFNFEHGLPLRYSSRVRHQLLIGVDWQANRAKSGKRQFGFDQLDPLTGTSTIETTTAAGDSIRIPALGPYIEENDFDSEEWGVTIQDRIAFGERWRLLTALRFDHAGLDFRIRPALVPGSVAGDVRLEEWSARSGLLHHLTDNVALFINYGESFRPTIGASANGDFIFDPQTSDQWEAGLKMESPGKRLQLSAAVFQINNENAVSRIGSDALGNAVFGKLDQRVRGVEAEITARLADRLSLIGHYSLMDSEVSGHPLVAGNRTYGTPRHSAALWMRHSLVQHDRTHLRVNFGMEYRSAVWASNANQLEIPATALLHFGLEYRLGRCTLRLNLRNLTDEDHTMADAIEVPGDPTSAIYAYPGSPRQLRFSCAWEF